MICEVRSQKVICLLPDSLQMLALGMLPLSEGMLTLAMQPPCCEEALAT